MATLWCTRYVTRPRLRLLEKRDTEYKFIQVLSLSFSLPLSLIFVGEKELKELKFLSVNSLEVSSFYIAPPPMIRDCSSYFYISNNF